MHAFKGARPTGIQISTHTKENGVQTSRQQESAENKNMSARIAKTSKQRAFLIGCDRREMSEMHHRNHATN